MGLDTGGILQDTFPGILNGGMSLPSFNEHGPENIRGKGTMAEKICRQIFTDVEESSESFGNLSKNTQCSILMRDMEKEDVSVEDLREGINEINDPYII